MRTGGIFFTHLTWSRFACSLSNLYGCTIKINWFTPEIVWPCVEDHIAICACVKSKNHVSLEWDGKSVTTIVLGGDDFLLRVSSFGDLAAFMAILAIFSLCTRRNGNLWVSGENFDTGIRFLELISLWGTIFHSAIWRRFLLIFAFDVLDVHHTYTSGLHYLTYWRRKCVACFIPYGENFHQVWSWCDHPLPSLAFLLMIHYVTLTFWLLSVVIHGGSNGQPLH